MGNLNNNNKDLSNSGGHPRQLQQKRGTMPNISVDALQAGLFTRLQKGGINNFYQIGDILGEGAFGQVCKVIHKQTGLIRAMKTIKKSTIVKEDQEKLFAEMSILKILDHPNILRLYELYQDKQHYYLITEYCSGGELFDKIQSMSHFTEQMAAECMKQILSAVVYCHTNKVVHRDLKPENLLYDSNGKNASIQVIDFGTSRRFDSLKKMTQRMGTPYYIAPEVLDQNYDEKCDVWSCGVILYILICGYPPFGGKTEDEILRKVRQANPQFDPQDWDKISNEGRNLIKKMLTKDPQKRCSAEEAYNDPWIQKNSTNNPINKKALSNLSSFCAQSQLKQAILTFIASQVVNHHEQQQLRQTFAALDKNGDGRLSRAQLITGYITITGDKDQAEAQVDNILKEVDLNNSGEIDFTEFLMAAMNIEILTSQLKIQQAFKIFDLDGNGYITKDEVENLMGDFSDDQWRELLKEVDTNKDGKISLGQFIDFILVREVASINTNGTGYREEQQINQRSSQQIVPNPQPVTSQNSPQKQQ